MHLDLAWAHVQRKRDADALLHLMEAERVAPEAVRYDVMVRELVREKRLKTYALAQICEALGMRLPMVVVPMVNNKLWGHPAWAGNLATLRQAGVVLLDAQSGAIGEGPVLSGTGGEVVDRFDPAWVTAQLKTLMGA